MLKIDGINHDLLDCYILNEQPTTCGLCGVRTNFLETNDGLQIHECLNSECRYKFITEDN
jgi:hypothetical protein